LDLKQPIVTLAQGPRQAAEIRPPSAAPTRNSYDDQSDIRVSMTAALTVALASVVILLFAVCQRLRRAREVGGLAKDS